MWIRYIEKIADQGCKLCSGTGWYKEDTTVHVHGYYMSIALPEKICNCVNQRTRPHKYFTPALNVEDIPEVYRNKLDKIPF